MSTSAVEERKIFSSDWNDQTGRNAPLKWAFKLYSPRILYLNTFVLCDSVGLSTSNWIAHEIDPAQIGIESKIYSHTTNNAIAFTFHWLIQFHTVDSKRAVILTGDEIRCFFRLPTKQSKKNTKWKWHLLTNGDDLKNACNFRVFFNEINDFDGQNEFTNEIHQLI